MGREDGGLVLTGKEDEVLKSVIDGVYEGQEKIGLSLTEMVYMCTVRVGCGPLRLALPGMVHRYM